MIPGAKAFACWNGHEFEVMSGDVVVSDSYPLVYAVWRWEDREAPAFEYHFAMHFPIDPRVRVEDVRGATVAYPNETNDGWLFAHCDEDWHHDHEMRLRAAADAVFGPVHREAQQGLAFAFRLLLNRDNDANRATGDNARLHADLLSRFHADVTAALLREARSRHLGYYHQNPHGAHVGHPLQQAIVSRIAAWSATAEKLTEYNVIRIAVEKVLATVKTRHAYETRWAQDARLEAERKAAEAAAEEAETAGDAAPEGSGE